MIILDMFFFFFFPSRINFIFDLCCCYYIVAVTSHSLLVENENHKWDCNHIFSSCEVILSLVCGVGKEMERVYVKYFLI